ncbi:hypothetical protein [Stratiformator vulcanicus]|uniref:hypothetical protein n=1 Tax=Stratiformator vulcanicus TaxID=2527980 RepID=UPI002877E814|nr:hypothetical protein [Stratiformator vulcanicus]
MPTSLLAQDSDNAGAPARVDSRSASPSGSEKRPPELFSDATRKQFYTWLKERERPPATIENIELTGAIGDKLAELAVRYSIQIDSHEGPHPVLLGIPTATLTSTRYDGPGSAKFRSLDASEGYVFDFSGRGTHTLVLNVLVRVERKASRRGLRIGFPTTPAKSTAKLKFEEPVTDIARQAGARGIITERSADEPNSFKMAGFGNEFAVEWQRLADQSGEAETLKVSTSISVAVVAETIRVQALQRLQSTNGPIERVKVSLPAGFTVREAVGRLVAGYTVTTEDGQVFAEVLLQEPAAGTLEIDWQLERPLENTEQPSVAVEFDGFQVDGVPKRSHKGVIVLTQSRDFNLLFNRQRSRNVQKIDVRDSGFATGSAAFEFLNQPFRFAFEARRVTPAWLVRPAYTLRFSEEQVEINCKFRCSILRGDLEEIEVSWPGANDWQLLPKEGAGARVLDFPDAPDEKSRLQFQINYGDTREFEFGFAGILSDTDIKSLERIRLPKVIGGTVGNAIVNVESTDRFDAILVDESGAPIPFRTTPSGDTLSSIYAIEAGSTIVRPRIKPRSRVTDVVTEIGVSVGSRRTTFEQHFSVNVRYGSINQLVFRHDSLADHLPVITNEVGRILNVSSQIEPTTSSKLIVVEFSQFQSGKFELTASWSVPLMPFNDPQTVKDQALSVATAQRPLYRPEPRFAVTTSPLQVVNASVSGCRLRTLESSLLPVSPVSEEWARFNSEDRSSIEWASVNVPKQLTIEISRPNLSDPAQMLGLRANIKLLFDRSGQLVGRIDQPIVAGVFGNGIDTPVIVSVPETVQVTAMYIDGKRVATNIVETVGGLFISVKRDDLKVSAASQSDAKIATVVFRAREAVAPSMWERFIIQSPRIVTAAPVKDVSVEISLPSKLYLWNDPDGLRPMFEWAWSLTGASRRPAAEFSQTDGEISFGATRDIDWRRYNFEGAAYPDIIIFSIVSTSLVFLVGAVVAALLVFLIIKNPVLRSPLCTVLWIGLGGTLWIIIGERLFMFIPPAVVGAVIVLIAAAVEQFQRARFASPIIRVEDDHELSGSISLIDDFVDNKSDGSIDESSSLDNRGEFLTKSGERTNELSKQSLPGE